jgi:AbrB family looped-hinge helix DNA binding protein
MNGMAKTKVTRKYQITIPQEVRKKMELRIGDELLIREENDKILMEKPVEIDRLGGSWNHIDSTEKFMQEVRRLWKTWRLK